MTTGSPISLHDRCWKSHKVGKILAAKAQSMLEYETASLSEVYAIFDRGFYF